MNRKEKLFSAALILSFAATGAVIGGAELKPVIMEKYSSYELSALTGSDSAAETGEYPQDILLQSWDAAPEDASSDEELAFVPKTAGPDVMVSIDLSEVSGEAAGEESIGEDPENGQPADSVEEELSAAEGMSSLGWLEDYEFTQVDHSYFSDALFIGDSRTVGIKLYGGLTEPVYFASTGMSVFSVTKASADVKGYGKLTLSQVLSKKTYGKIYIMLGINELASKTEDIVKKYQTVIDTVRSIQPEAKIFLCANLHVTGKKSLSDKTYNNANVDRLNEGIRGLASENSAYYIDVNEVYDDGEGNLSSEYASDYAHLYGRYYGMWVDWLCTKGIE